ncbi:RING-H2 finger protein [Candidatus Dependentiae bacterium]
MKFTKSLLLSPALLVLLFGNMNGMQENWEDSSSNIKIPKNADDVDAIEVKIKAKNEKCHKIVKEIKERHDFVKDLSGRISARKERKRKLLSQQYGLVNMLSNEFVVGFVEGKSKDLIDPINGSLIDSTNNTVITLNKIKPNSFKKPEISLKKGIGATLIAIKNLVNQTRISVREEEENLDELMGDIFKAKDKLIKLMTEKNRLEVQIEKLSKKNLIAFYNRKNKGEFLAPCVVCTDFIKKDETVNVLNCGHKFHKECIDGWFKECDDHQRPRTCPTCKQTDQNVVGSVKQKEVAAKALLEKLKEMGNYSVIKDVLIACSKDIDTVIKKFEDLYAELKKVGVGEKYWRDIKDVVAKKNDLDVFMYASLLFKLFKKWNQKHQQMVEAEINSIKLGFNFQ